MIGIRSILLVTGLALVVTLIAPRQVQPLVLDWVDAGNGLLVMRHEVSIAQWQLCVDEGGCSLSPKPGPSASDESFPVTGVGILDVQEFVLWAKRRASQDVQLPTLQQWQSFSEVPPTITTKRFTDPRLAWAATYGNESKIDPTLKRPGGFGHTSKNIADIRGNVWEWTSTCVVETEASRCPAYFAMGEHEAKVPIFVRDPASGGCATGTPPALLGLRLVLAKAVNL